MEVLRHGNTYKQVWCTECNALLSYCKRDIERSNRIEEYLGKWHTSYEKYIICPECKNKIIL